LRRLPPARLPLLAAAVLLAPLTGSAADFLPAVSLHLEAARYAPVETDLYWTTTIGGGADVFGVGGFRGYIVGDVETIIGSTRRAFDASQANYHLETGGRWLFHGVTVNPFFHHVSRHMIDREKEPAVDWNMLGVRAEAGFSPGGRRAKVGGSVGHTTLASLVGYRWELIGHGDVELLGNERTSGYVRAGARFVTVDPEPELPRGDFLDWIVEGGFRYRRDHRVFDAFAAYERRNDVLLLVPSVRTRGLFGIRFRFGEDQ
jgi:hypothetical protein